MYRCGIDLDGTAQPTSDSLLGFLFVRSEQVGREFGRIVVNLIGMSSAHPDPVVWVFPLLRCHRRVVTRTALCGRGDVASGPDVVIDGGVVGGTDGQSLAIGVTAM